MKKTFALSIAAALMLFAASDFSFAQGAGAPGGGDAVGEISASPDAPPPPTQKSGEFMQVLFGSGSIGFMLWMALFGAAGVFIYLAVDLGILIRPSKIMPADLIANVEMAMKEGDIVKALQFCENSPTPMASILKAGFSHVEEGFDIIEQAIGTAADIEIEKMMQRISWLSVVSNISTMLGLLGTVQGMIMAFGNLATGTPDMGALALAISQALWTTAAGLTVTKLDIGEKRALGLQEGRNGERTHLNVLGVGLPACIFAFFYWLLHFVIGSQYDYVLTVAFITTLTVAAADTIASEIGVRDKKVWLITTFERVKRGTNGGISVLGTSVAFAAAIFTGLVGWLLIFRGLDIHVLLPIFLGVAGNLIDSVLGATLERRGELSKYANNCFSALICALIAMIIILYIW